MSERLKKVSFYFLNKGGTYDKKKKNCSDWRLSRRSQSGSESQKNRQQC